MLDNLFMDFEKKITTSIKKETDSTKSELRSDFNDTIKNRTLDMVKGVHLEGELKKHKDNLTDYFNNSLDTIRRECSKNTEKRGLIEKLEIQFNKNEETLKNIELTLIEHSNSLKQYKKEHDRTLSEMDQREIHFNNAINIQKKYASKLFDLVDDYIAQWEKRTEELNAQIRSLSDLRKTMEDIKKEAFSETDSEDPKVGQ